MTDLAGEINRLALEIDRAEALIAARRLLAAVREGDKRPTRDEIDEALRLTGDLSGADDVGAH